MSVPVQTCPNPTLRRCRVCGQHLPLDCFRLRRRGSPERHYECGRCHGLLESARKRRREAEALQPAIREIARERRPERVIALTNAVIRELGGVNKLCELWVANIRCAPPGRRWRGQALLATLRLIEVCQPARADLSALDDAALARIVDGYIARNLV